MSLQDGENVTRLLEASREGDVAAGERLFELVYDQLRTIARQSRYVGGHGETMQPTALANEAYLVLRRRFPEIPQEQVQDRAAFTRIVALAMRTILRDHWRKRTSEKRGGGQSPGQLPDQGPPERESGELDALDYLALDGAMDQLEKYNKRWFEVVMHRYFAGRSIEETAEMLNVGVSTVKTGWQLARAWLRRQIDGAL